MIGLYSEDRGQFPTTVAEAVKQAAADKDPLPPPAVPVASINLSPALARLLGG